MKKNYFKKSISLVLTVLMLMSCWVFVAPTEAEAVTIDVGYDIKLNYEIVTKDLSKGGNIQIWYYKFNEDGTLDTSTEHQYTWVNSFSSSGHGTKGEHTITSADSDYSPMAKLPGWPFKLSINVVSTGGLKNNRGKLYLKSFYVGDKNVLNGWEGTTNSETRTWYNNMAALDGISMDWSEPSWVAESTVSANLGNVQVPSYGTRSVSPSYQAKFKDEKYGAAWPQSYVTYSQSSTGVSLSQSSGTLNSVSASNAALALFTDATGKKTVDVTAKMGTSSVTSVAKVTLLAPKKDLLYENLFSFSDWYYSDSSKYNDSNLTFNVDNGSFTINNPTTDTSTEYTTTATTTVHPSNYYSMPVTAGKTYYFTMKTANANSTEVFFMWKDSSNNGISYPSKYFTGDGTWWTEFTAPTDATHVEIRFDNNTDGTNVTFSDIAVYEKERADALGIKEWTTRPIRVPYTYNASTPAANSLTAAARTGYTFNGWKDVNGNAYTAVNSSKANTTVYADFTINTYTVTYIFANGQKETKTYNYGDTLDYKPDNSSVNPDDSYHYSVAWDKVFANTVTENLTYTEKTVSKAHSWSGWTTTQAATCTAPGSQYRTCTVCGFVQTQEIAQKTHTLVRTKANAATCTAPGNKEYYSCSACSKYFTDATGSTEITDKSSVIIPKEDHTYAIVVEGTSTGKTETDTHDLKCLYCDAVDKQVHAFYPEYADEANCTHTGDTHMKCDCGETYVITGQLNPDKHQYDESTAVPAGDGKTHIASCQLNPDHATKTYKCKDADADCYCDICGQELIHNYVIESKDNLVSEAKCDVDAVYYLTCQCGKYDTATWTDEGSALEHSFTKYVDQGDATCDKEGTEIAVCDRDGCNETDSRSTGKKRDHKFDGNVKNNNNGTHSFECSYDDCSVYGGTVDCSSWKENVVEGKCECTVCGYTKAHTWGNWSQATGNTGVEAGKMVHECTDCKAVEEDECTYVQVDHKDATCTAPELTEYKCNDCGHAYTKIGTAATGHNFSKDQGVKDNNNGTHSYLCANGCGKYGYDKTENATVPCEYKYTNTGVGTHMAECKVCSYTASQTCSGGTATCTAQAVCEFCNTAYGTTADHVLTGTEKYLKKATDATCIANETYYKYCIGCENVFSDTETYEKPDTMTEHDYTCKDEYLYKATDAACEVNETYYAYCSNPNCKKSSEDANNTFEKDGTALDHIWVNPQYNGEETLKHTFTCERGCGKTMTANCADSAITFGLEEATCTEQGYTTVQCTACNHTWNINYTDALGHDYTQKIYDVAHTKSEANCDQAKVYWYDCSRCDKNAKDETDTDKYTVLSYTSGDVRQHSFKKAVADTKYLAAEATCTAAAKYYYSCEYDDCDAYDTTRTFPSGTALGHDFTEQIQDADHLISNADCVNGSKYYYDCSRCAENAKNDKDKDKYTYTLDDFSGHEMTHTVAKDATCKENGNYEYWYCSNCNTYYKDENGNEAYLGQSATVIKAPGHTYVTVKSEMPTCEKDGHPQYKYCSVCETEGYKGELDEGYKAKGHNFTGAYYCDTANNYHAQYCVNSNCDMVTLTDAEGNPYEVKSFGIVVDGLQIKYSVVYDGLDFVINGGVPCDTDNYTTETSDEGIHTHANTCVCGNGTTKTYSKEETFVETVAPTCTTKGYDSYACPDCGKTWKINEVPATNHTPAEKAVSNGDGTHSIYCTVEGCGYKISTSKCSGGTATCKDKAVCEICGASYGETTGHTFEGEWVYQNDAKCGVNGTEKNTCAVCSTEVTREAAGTALEHDMSAFGYTLPEGWDAPDFEETTVKAPTCGNEGLSISYCQRKDCYHYVTIIAEKTDEGHAWGNPDTLGDCSSGVSIVYTCSICGDKKTEVGDSEHKFEQILKIDATCTSNGYIRYQCTVCKFVEELNERTVDFKTDATEVEFLGMKVNISDLKAKGHVWGADIVDKAATCGMKGRGHKICSVCQTKVEFDIPATGDHRLKVNSGYPASCDKSGLESYKSCTRCSYSETAKVIPATGHADSNADGKCDSCNSTLESINAKKDGCICHKENGFMKFIYSILRFFWKLFKINKTCACGAVHY